MDPNATEVWRRGTTVKVGRKVFYVDAVLLACSEIRWIGKLTHREGGSPLSETDHAPVCKCGETLFCNGSLTRDLGGIRCDGCNRIHQFSAEVSL